MRSRRSLQPRTSLRRLFTLPLVTSLAFASFAVAAGPAAALDAVLYLANVTGGNTAPGRAGSMVVEAYSFENTANGTGGSASFSTVKVIKPVDRATPILLGLNASGNAVPSGRLEVFGATPTTPVFTIEFTLVRVDSVSAAGGPSGERESIGLSFNEIKWTYDAGGGTVVDSCWNLQFAIPC